MKRLSLPKVRDELLGEAEGTGATGSCGFKSDCSKGKSEGGENTAD